MSKTFKAAYIADDGSSTSGGILLTTEEQSNMTDDELMKAALVGLAEVNENAGAIGEDGFTEADISIGEWRD